MSAAAMQDLSNEYLHWLKGNLIAFERGTSQILSTPFLDPFNDGIEISLDADGGRMLLHDGGKTLANLLDMGVQIDKSERRQHIIQNAIAGCGVTLNNGRLETLVTPANRAQRMHFLTTAILRLNDLWMSSSPRSITDFFEIVKEYFDEHNVLYTANKSITGRTVEHPIDFIVPLPKGRDRLVKLVSRPSVQTAKIVSFTWFDLMDAQPNAERIVFVNDMAVGDYEGIDGANTTETKAVNDNVASILKGYSDKVYLWSTAQNDESFARQISTAN